MFTFALKDLVEMFEYCFLLCIDMEYILFLLDCGDGNTCIML